MKLLIINVLFRLIAFKAFAVPGEHPLESTTWSGCKLEKNGLFKLEKGCKTLQICYKSELAGKLATGTLKFGGRFRLGKRVNERPLSDCAGVVARNEWHALNVSKISDRIFTIQSSLGLDGQFSSVFDIKPNDFIEAMNISKEFGPIETDFVKALHLGAFMNELDGIAFRILALDLISSIGQNGTGLCKKTCLDWEPATNTTTIRTPTTTTTTSSTTTTTTMSTPTTTTVLRPPHFCKQAVETPHKNKTFEQKCPNGEQFCYLLNCTSATNPNNRVTEWGCAADQNIKICAKKSSEYGFELGKNSCLCYVGSKNTNVQLKRMRLSVWSRPLFIPVIHPSFSFASRCISQFNGVLVVILLIVCGRAGFSTIAHGRCVR